MPFIPSAMDALGGGAWFGAWFGAWSGAWSAEDHNP